MSKVFGSSNDARMGEQTQELFGQKRDVSFIASGIQGFDDNLGSGLPSGNIYLASGGVGSNSVLFAQQILYNTLIAKGKVTYYTAAQSSTDIIQDMQLYGMNVQPYVDDGSWVFSRLVLPNMKKIMDVLPEVPMEHRINLEGSMSELMNHFHESVKEGRSTAIHLQSLIRNFSLDDIHNLLFFMTGVARRYGGIHFVLLTEGAYDQNVAVTIKDAVDAVFEINTAIRGNEVENIVNVQKIRSVIPKSRVIRLALRENGLATETIRRVQ
jgi:KaiC/GvpD/RAD55 family RecA-like ATPase